MILVKSTVKPRTLLMMAACANVAIKLAWPVTITSGNDSKHMAGSKHYSGEAIDIRSKNFPTKEAKQEFIAAVLARLDLTGAGYQMFLESEGQANEHFHLEYDPL
jgi:hypothetical protein